MKKIPLITLISFLILIPNTEAASISTTETKYHYYFFSEPYHNSDDLNNLKDTGTINYTKFASYRNWESESSIKRIDLDNNCHTKWENNWDTADCWDLQTFYRMWDELYHGTGTIVCKGNTCSQDLKETSENRFYHAHGAYKSIGETIWRNDIDSSMKQNGNVPKKITINNINQFIDGFDANAEAYQLACATIPENDIDEEVGKYYEGNEKVIQIKRNLKSTSTIADEGKVDWNGSSSGHLSNCSTDPIRAYNGISGRNLSDKGVYSPALYRITTTTENFKCSGDIDSPQGKCNDTVDVTSQCDKQTIEWADGDKNNPETNIARAVTSLRQDISMTNILTPTTIYQGGGVKIGFLYKAKVTLKIIGDIDYDGSSLTDNTKKTLKNKIVAALESTIGNPQTTIEADNFYFTDKNGKIYNLGEANLEINCDQDSSGNVFDSNGKVVTTTCKILLPKSKVNLGSGIVEYINGAEGKGINNEFYTPIKYNGELYLHATFSGLSAIQSGDISLNDWDASGITIKYDGKTNSSSNCVVNTYPRFYNSDNQKYKFIYRPIDINNPFPNRNAGVNWYSWYEVPENKNRLESSYNYNKLDYTMIIYNQESREIKNNYRDSYFSWRGIDEYGTSEFVERYKGDTP